MVGKYGNFEREFPPPVVARGIYKSCLGDPLYEKFPPYVGGGLFRLNLRFEISPYLGGLLSDPV